MATQVSAQVAQPLALADVLAENAALRAQLAAVRADMHEFTHCVSHDLRANLRHILAYATVIEEDAGPTLAPEVLGHLGTIHHAAKLMGLQMDGLKEFARIAAVVPQPSAVSLGDLVAEVLAHMQAKCSGRLVTWSLANTWPTLHADSALVRQVLTHVVGNAVKFTGATPAAHIDIGWEPCADDASRCTVWVQDNGAGFNSAHKSKLFHVFQRLHSQRSFEGLGMGLALTRKILERHACTAWAEGAEGAGCCVRFTLPLATA
ncbi:sensor histidine kinase [Rhodoferax aquaticus]|uniref:histidine kinase n=1 Tax=Rhodoferax aquaticus TaxID=2527691 RepID=A0A515ETB1_9BURK|nr:ATP-binding protein [Rhodoferax aquaticus]QDL55891.1 two-component sensor histidine kinase [Rhodoferax aquaticus]